MKAKDFLREFDPEQFPSIYGPWILMEWHDPPWPAYILNRMAKQGVIEIEWERSRYRLTLKAAKLALPE